MWRQIKIRLKFSLSKSWRRIVVELQLLVFLTPVLHKYLFLVLLPSRLIPGGKEQTYWDKRGCLKPRTFLYFVQKKKTSLAPTKKWTRTPRISKPMPTDISQLQRTSGFWTYSWNIWLISCPKDYFRLDLMNPLCGLYAGNIKFDT
jgi:hypothetical protein